MNHKGNRIAVAPMLSHILRNTASTDHDKYGIHDIDGYVPFTAEHGQVNGGVVLANDYITRCESRAKHELQCYLMCIYHKLAAVQVLST